MISDECPQQPRALAGSFRPSRKAGGTVADIAWLAGHRLRSVECHNYSSAFFYDDDAILAVECLWRLLESGRIRVTSEDNGHQFGLPAPIIVAEELSRRLVGASIESVNLRDGTLDLELRFETGHVLQILPTSAGYEAWNLCHHGDMIAVAVGGGKLEVEDDTAPGVDRR